MPMKGSKEARHGLDAEKLVIEYLEKNLDEINECLREIDIIFSPIKKVEKPQKKEKKRIKCDIILQGTDNSSLCISLKTVTNASFHHLDRRWLDEWRRILNMPTDVYDIFRESILRVANNSKEVFIKEHHQKRIKEFIQSKFEDILKEIFEGGEEDVKVLAIFDRKNKPNKIYFFNIDQVICFFKQQEISFSNKGILKIGKFITLQRKGGNGSHIKKNKCDLNHPGNQLQFKFKPLEFVKYVENNKDKLKDSLKYCCLIVT
jgi:hypothetical protein